MLLVIPEDVNMIHNGTIGTSELSPCIYCPLKNTCYFGDQTVKGFEGQLT